jgi:hypothetical protein
MIGVPVGTKRLGLWLLCSVVAALVAIVLSLLTYDFGVFLFLLLLWPALAGCAVILALVLLVGAVTSSKRRLFCLAALGVLLTFIGTYFAMELGGKRTRNEIRWTLLWFYRSRELKAEVLAQPEPPQGELRSFDWDGWGMAGQDTEVYLVFDPTDRLSAAAKSGRPGKFPGIPCEVPQVYKLERHWYSVLYYTNEIWDYCGR